MTRIIAAHVKFDGDYVILDVAPCDSAPVYRVLREEVEIDPKSFNVQCRTGFLRTSDAMRRSG